MNWLELWTQTSIAKAVGQTLLHSLWEGATVAALLAAALLLLRSPRVRYAAACLALVTFLLAFAVTLARLWPATGGSGAARLVLPHAAVVEFEPTGAVLPAAFQLGDLLPWLGPFWVLGVAAFHLRALAGWLSARRLGRAGVCCAPGDWDLRLDRLAERLRVSRAVKLLESSLADAPLVIGYLRPVILMPAGLLAGLPAAQVEAVLAHELAHIMRRDYLINLLQTFVEGLLFYHPAVWWISRVIRAEREHCCDDIAVQVCGDARGYAAALAALEQNRSATREWALAATGGSLVKRIRRILKSPERSRNGLAPHGSTIALTIAVAGCLAAWQTTPAPNPGPKPDPQPTRTQESAPVATPTAAVMVADAAPAQEAQTDQLQKLEQQLRKEQAKQTAAGLQTPYRKWLNEDVAYIITDEERAAFKALQTDDQHEAFIEQFWLKRDPTPGTPENESKEEHYRRIAYANEHFASSIPGWKTDRGRIYIQFGPPDEIEDHSSGGKYVRPPEEGGGETQTVPFQQWRYKYIEGVGNNIVIEFVDPTYTHEYRMTADPTEKDALKYVFPKLGVVATATPVNSFISVGGDPQVTINTGSGGVVTVTLELDQNGMVGQWDITGSAVSGTQAAANIRDHLNIATDTGRRLRYNCTLHLAAGSYTLNVAVKDPTGATRTKSVAFYVN